MLGKYLNQGTLLFPKISYHSNQLVDVGELNLKSAISCRKSDILKSEDDESYTFVDLEKSGEIKGKVDKFIWNLWEVTPELEDDLYNTVMKEKMFNEQIPTTLSLEAVDHLVFMMYNGNLRLDIKFETLLELNGIASTFNLKPMVQSIVGNAIHYAMSLPNLRRAWKSGKGQGEALLETRNSAIQHRTISFIICNPEQVFASKDLWYDMPEQLLQLLHPKSLFEKLEEYKEHGATLDNRKVYCVGENCFLDMSHFQLLHFLLDWIKMKVSYTMMEQSRELFEEPNLYETRQALGGLVDILDATKFDVSKFIGDPAVKDAETFISYLTVFIHLKNVANASIWEQKNLVLDALPSRSWFENDEDDSPPLSKRPRTEEERSLVSVLPPLAIEGSDSNIVLDKIKSLFGKERMSDVGILVEEGSKELRLHSFVLRLRQSVFTDALNEPTDFNFGDCSFETVSNFFQSFYLSKHDMKAAVKIDLEYCFLSLLFRVEFLLEPVFLYLHSVSESTEGMVLKYVSVVRMAKRNGSISKKLNTLKNEMFQNLQEVTKTVSFQYLMDENMVVDLLRDYVSPDKTNFYFDLILSLEKTSKTIQWLGKEDEKIHGQRMRIWKDNGVIQLDKVSIDELMVFARRGLLDMEDAIKYSYLIGCNSLQKNS